MGHKLRITREKPQVKESTVRSAGGGLMTETFDEGNGGPSTWGGIGGGGVFKREVRFLGGIIKGGGSKRIGY